MKSFFFLVVLCVTRTVYGDCPAPAYKENMEIITNVTLPAPEGTVVDYACQIGYTPTGSGEVTCAGGQWTSLIMTCQKSTCGNAGPVLNGHVDYSEGTTFGAYAHVVCNEGHDVVGIENRIYCGANGWEGRLAVCEVIKCNPPKQIANGSFSPDENEYAHSVVVTYSCVQPFKLNGSSELVCSDNRKFTPEPPNCVLVQCPTPVINFGVVATGGRPPHNHLKSLMLRCNIGYTMEGLDVIKCDINSKWSPAIPKCNPIECEAPVITNGNLMGESRLTYKFSETVTVKCSKGYTPDTSSILTCGEGSSWSGTFPVCKASSGGHKLVVTFSVLGAIAIASGIGYALYRRCLKKNQGKLGHPVAPASPVVGI